MLKLEKYRQNNAALKNRYVELTAIIRSKELNPEKLIVANKLIGECNQLTDLQNDIYSSAHKNISAMTSFKFSSIVFIILLIIFGSYVLYHTLVVELINHIVEINNFEHYLTTTNDAAFQSIVLGGVILSLIISIRSIATLIILNFSISRKEK